MYYNKKWHTEIDDQCNDCKYLSVCPLTQLLCGGVLVLDPSYENFTIKGCGFYERRTKLKMLQGGLQDNAREDKKS